MYFWCLIFNLSGPCELLFLLLFYSLLDLRSSECDGVSLYVVHCSVNVSVCFVCCMLVNCLVKPFAMCLGVVAIFVVECYGSV